MALAISVSLITAIYQSFNSSLLKVSLGFLSITVALGALASLDILQFSPLVTLGQMVFGLAISSISFLLTRFTLALTKILFGSSRSLKSIGIFVIFLAAILGSILEIYAELQAPTSEFQEILLTSTGVKLFTIVSGIIFSLGVTLSSWLANRLRGVPWNHPDLFRDWVLTVGSWRGTSFHNLDLSGVNFRNAKLGNTDLRARKLYRTCFQGVIGLERARVDSRYLDLENPKVQRLLTHGYSEDKDFSQLNLRGAYLQNADMRQFKLIDTDLTGADLQSADLRGSILVRTQVIGVDFTDANLTGICIEDWSVNSQTCFTNVQCDYIYRKLDENGEPTDRYPIERNFEPREFESLYQEVGNVVELIFKEGVNWRAFSFTLQKLQLEDNGLGLELKGVEKRGDLWVVKVTHNENYSRQEVEQRLYGMYDEMKTLLAAKEQQINKLLGIAADQAEALKSYSKQPFGNSFFITGSTITNLAGSGEIEYNQAADQVRSIVARGCEPAQATPTVQNLLAQLQGLSVATTSETQAELIKQVILTEAQKDPFFKQFLVQQGQQLISTMPENAIATAIRNAIVQLR
ncbi:MAG TPA: pentapeptide repeat-containing protein [Stenomitos sp.]